MCHDYLNACSHLFGYGINCDYLPPRNGDIKCYHHFTYCHAPPRVQNAVVVRRNGTAHYTCNEGFTLEGYRDITCMLTGKWPKAPHCVPAAPEEETSNLLPPLLSGFVIVILIIIITVICIIQLKAKQTQRVNRDQMQADIELKEKKRNPRDICCLFDKEPRV